MEWLKYIEDFFLDIAQISTLFAPDSPEEHPRE